ncbi:MAG: CaiB/BaiF CoA transferase family protein [Pigmentiphaga sp.]
MSRSQERQGPLTGVRVLEFTGLGPAPFAAMLLADLGADVVRIERSEAQPFGRGATARGRQIITLDLQDAVDRDHALALAARADVLIEGFRPGVMERLGLGPDTLLQRNPSLVYGRMTGWGQSGPRAHTAGHDINYIAITGALHAIGPTDEPNVPLNLVGDYGGGALYLAMGILAALLESRRSGLGQTIDCAICDGTVSMMSLMIDLLQAGRWTDARASNVLDGAAPYYRNYRCADHKFIAVGAIEPKFFALLLERLELTDDPLFAEQNNKNHWAAQRAAMQQVFARRPRAEWLQRFEGSDACVAPVNSLVESFSDPHLKARKAFITVDDQRQPAPAPRFSRTPAEARPHRVCTVQDILAAWDAV